MVHIIWNIWYLAPLSGQKCSWSLHKLTNHNLCIFYVSVRRNAIRCSKALAKSYFVQLAYFSWCIDNESPLTVQYYLNKHSSISVTYCCSLSLTSCRLWQPCVSQSSWFEAWELNLTNKNRLKILYSWALKINEEPFMRRRGSCRWTR